MADKSYEEYTRQRISLRNQMKKAAGRRARSPCSERSKDKCLRECVWADYTFWWGGECKNNDLFSEYISVICDKELLDKVAYKREVRNIAKHLGYTVEDFGQTAWKDVTKTRLCQKITSDTKKILSLLQKTNEPWRDLGISKKTYDDIFNYAALQYAEGKSFYGIFDALSKYINKKNIKRTVAGLSISLAVILVIVTMVPVIAPATKPVGTAEETRLYRTGQGVGASMVDPRYVISTAARRKSAGYLEPEVSYNSILDLLGSSKDDVVLKNFSHITDINELKNDPFESSALARRYCDAGTSIEKQYVDSSIAAIEESLGLPRNYKDLKDWGMLPGQQIYYGGAFGVSALTHHGIYLGDGVVLEVGQGPKACKKVSRNIPQFKDQMFGLSTLTNFARRAQRQNSAIYILDTPEDSDPDVIIRRLKRANELMGCWDYNILWNSCQSAANYVSFGVRESPQADAVIAGARWIVVGAGVLGVLMAGWMKKTRQLEDKVPLLK